MKKILFLTLTLFLGFAVLAQKPADHRREGKRPDITKLVSNLTEKQKSKLDAITNDSRQRIDKLRARKRAVRDSIENFLKREGNQSKYLYPLFDREAKLQVEISREMYSTKVRIDEVLTKEQRAEFQKASKEQRGKHGKKRQ